MLSKLDKYLYPGAVWEQEDTKVIILESSLSTIKFAEPSSTIQQELSISAFTEFYSPVVSMEDIIEILSSDIPENAKKALSKDPAYTNLALVLLSTMNQIDEEWYVNPEIIFSVLRFAVEAFVTMEIKTEGKAGGSKKFISKTINGLYSDISESSNKLLAEIKQESENG